LRQRRHAGVSELRQPRGVPDAQYFHRRTTPATRAQPFALCEEVVRCLMIIAIDGPAASGKGTLGKRLAAHFGLRHLDTGLIYRAVAHNLEVAGERLDDVVVAARVACTLDPSSFDERALKGQDIGEAASVVSAIPEVRAALVEFQREFGRAPPGAVLDGR